MKPTISLLKHNGEISYNRSKTRNPHSHSTASSATGSLTSQGKHQTGKVSESIRGEVTGVERDARGSSKKPKGATKGSVAAGAGAGGTASHSTQPTRSLKRGRTGQLSGDDSESRKRIKKSEKVPQGGKQQIETERYRRLQRRRGGLDGKGKSGSRETSITTNGEEGLESHQRTSSDDSVPSVSSGDHQPTAEEMPAKPESQPKKRKRVDDEDLVDDSPPRKNAKRDNAIERTDQEVQAFTTPGHDVSTQTLLEVESEGMERPTRAQQDEEEQNNVQRQASEFRPSSNDDRYSDYDTENEQPQSHVDERPEKRVPKRKRGEEQPQDGPAGKKARAENSVPHVVSPDSDRMEPSRLVDNGSEIIAAARSMLARSYQVQTSEEPEYFKSARNVGSKVPAYGFPKGYEQGQKILVDISKNRFDHAAHRKQQVTEAQARSPRQSFGTARDYAWSDMWSVSEELPRLQLRYIAHIADFLDDVGVDRRQRVSIVDGCSDGLAELLAVLAGVNPLEADDAELEARIGGIFSSWSQIGVNIEVLIQALLGAAIKQWCLEQMPEAVNIDRIDMIIEGLREITNDRKTPLFDSKLMLTHTAAELGKTREKLIRAALRRNNGADAKAPVRKKALKLARNFDSLMPFVLPNWHVRFHHDQGESRTGFVKAKDYSATDPWHIKWLDSLTKVFEEALLFRLKIELPANNDFEFSFPAHNDIMTTGEVTSNRVLLGLLPSIFFSPRADAWRPGHDRKRAMFSVGRAFTTDEAFVAN